MVVLRDQIFCQGTFSKLRRFYLSLQVFAIVANFAVLLISIYENIYARRGGDPTRIRIVTDPRAATINNPGYREYHQPTNGKASVDSRSISRNLGYESTEFPVRIRSLLISRQISAPNDSGINAYLFKVSGEVFFFTARFSNTPLVKCNEHDKTTDKQCLDQE